MTTKHYKYGGSTAARTLECSEWQELAATVPKPPESDAAGLGTALHTVMEKCLLDIALDPYDFENQTFNGHEIESEHIDVKIYPALDAFEQLMDTYDVDRYHCEVTFEYSEIAGGTVDFIGVSADDKTVVIADYKSGDGILVSAENNKQGLFYAMCAKEGDSEYFRKMVAGAEKIVIAIIQPTDRTDDPLSIWETDHDYLDTFTQRMMDAIFNAEQGGGYPVSGSHCAFCPAAAFCPAKTGLVAEAEKLPVGSIKIEQLGNALEIADGLESWISAVRKMAHEQLERGVAIPNHKLVNKRANRIWTDKEAVEKMLKNSKQITLDESYTKKLKSPAQIEKLCKAKGIDFDKYAEHVVAHSSGTTLVHESDPRKEAIPIEAAKVIAQRFA